MLRACIAIFAALFLAACAEKVWAPEDQVSTARYVSNEPPSISLFTVINTRTGSGAHSGLLINGSQRVLFDPAGTWHHPRVPERNDVHFGMTDQMVAFYRDYHARDTETEQFIIYEQKVRLPAQVVETILQRALSHGAAPKAQCARSISSILRGLPGLESVSTTWFPKRLRADFAKVPGVTETLYTEENDNLENHGVVLVDKDGVQVN